jgi:hypothetical protein
MTSRRGAVRVNPVTGKMEKVDAAAVPEGKHRDGCLLVDDRYVNAAKDLGLGNDKGACGGAVPAMDRGRGAFAAPRPPTRDSAPPLRPRPPSPTLTLSPPPPTLQACTAT